MCVGNGERLFGLFKSPHMKKGACLIHVSIQLVRREFQGLRRHLQHLLKSSRPVGRVAPREAECLGIARIRLPPQGNRLPCLLKVPGDIAMVRIFDVELLRPAGPLPCLIGADRALSREIHLTHTAVLNCEQAPCGCEFRIQVSGAPELIGRCVTA